ncbi:MAG: pseudouridine synthase [Candidatus Thermofonsia Clade 1 bacterium]|jgi:23S rRNA pseudouridine2457 synthase|uniref:Pseudouridine synthase n=1 Tax=Candidatus Thermofonsia Clade 1 bacterium TaxID=2364210 RepID=A0A2M8PDW3_9CHLR|nr:MAG: pseudouridine synthase [Candidatus Thermofonsia Clade 1 bacterium]RMF51973.1 MAG: pseudouridine synthase [Chloroflexota bacterium]
MAATRAHKPTYVLRFWKPYGVLTQFTDPEGRPTLADYIPIRNVYSAGRLDFDSEGLLLLTNDGALIARLTNPRFAHPKTYLVQVERVPSEAELDQLRAGVLLKDGLTRPAQVRLLQTPPDLPERTPPIRYRASVPTAWLQITLTEGKKRQIRRMTAAIGYPTLRLVRVAIGNITLDGLRVGEYRALSQAQIAALWRALRPTKR